MKKLQDKVAIVTGGGQGVGLGIAQCLAAQGASIVITGRHEEKLKKAVDGLRAEGAPEVLTVVADARSRADAKKVIAVTIAKFKRLDILVNNAQSTVPGTAFEDHDDDAIRMVIESGYYGTVYFMQESFPYLKERGGSIINLGSREGIYGGLGHSIYAGNKEAIRGTSRAVAREWGKYKIRVNVICPAALTDSAKTYLDNNPEQAEMYRKEVSLGYFGDSHDDIGPVAAFLAGPDAVYVTGQTINVDGGQIML